MIFAKTISPNNQRWTKTVTYLPRCKENNYQWFEVAVFSFCDHFDKRLMSSLWQSETRPAAAPQVNDVVYFLTVKDLCVVLVSLHHSRKVHRLGTCHPLCHLIFNNSWLVDCWHYQPSFFCCFWCRVCVKLLLRSVVSTAIICLTRTL